MTKEIICYCSNVTRDDMKKAIDQGARTIDDIRRMTQACTKGNCKELSPKRRCCSVDILNVLKEESIDTSKNK